MPYRQTNKLLYFMPKQKKEKNMDLWESLPAAFCQTDEFFTIVKTSRFLRLLLHFPENKKEKLLLKDIFYSEEDFNKVKKLLEKKRTVGIKSFLITGDKQKIPVSVFSQPLKKEGEKGYVFYFLDISEKQKIKEELQRKIKDLQTFTEELKKSRTALLNILEDIEEARSLAEAERDKTVAIIENFPEGLAFFDSKNNLVSLNPRACCIISVSPDNLLNKPYKDIKNIVPFNIVKDVFSRKQPKFFKDEIKIDEETILEISAIPVKSAEEKVGTLVVLRDITREKIVEKLKTEFVSIAAHQLRTPLSAIKWSLKMVLDGDLGAISLEQRNFLEKTYQNNERMIRLINDLLNVTRIEEGRFLYDVKECDIIKLIEDVVVLEKTAAEQKKVKIIFKKPKIKLIKARVDREKIFLVFQNLIENAVRYSLPGGKVEVALVKTKKRPEIEVIIKDQGIGIPDKEKNRVFSKFFRGSNAVKTETEGTGLGLYIAKNIVNAHKGKIWFESKKNKGSVFYVTLPVK